MNDISSNDEKDRFWRRFIDDIIAMTTMTESQAQEFVDWMNTLYPNLNFTHEWSKNEANYLDIKLIIKDGKIQTDLFIKKTNKQLYLDYRSSHPPAVFKSIVYSQALRVRMICSEDIFVENQLTNLKEKFMDRHYPEDLILEQFGRAMAKSRLDLLKPKTYPHDASPVQLTRWRKRELVTPFIITFNKNNPPLQQWLTEEFHLLQLNEKNRRVFLHRPNVVYRQPPNIKRQLVKSKQHFEQLPFNDNDQEQPVPGCNKCDSRRCVTCHV